MRVPKFALLIVLCTVLTACVSSLLIGNGLQNRLMWALLKPLVGFDPSEVNLFEIPLVHERMTALLGEHYKPTVALLRTADQIQQEGALIYVASRVLEMDNLPLSAELESVQQAAGAVGAEVGAVQGQVEAVRDQVRSIKSAAGMVWNGDTNQLAVVLVEAGVNHVFTEQPAAGVELQPVWPADLQQVLERTVAAPATEVVPED